MESPSVKENNETTDYERYVVRRNLEDYWRTEEKVQLILTAMSSRVPITTLCPRSPDRTSRISSFSHPVKRNPRIFA